MHLPFHDISQIFSIIFEGNFPHFFHSFSGQRRQDTSRKKSPEKFTGPGNLIVHIHETANQTTKLRKFKKNLVKHK